MFSLHASTKSTRKPGPHMPGSLQALQKINRTNPLSQALRSATPEIQYLRNNTSVENIKALYAPLISALQNNYTGVSSQAEIQGIKDSLEGWESKNKAIIGPSYIPAQKIVHALEAAFFNGGHVTEEMIDQIAQHKARAQNIHNLILNRPASPASAYQAETKEFVKELTERVKKLDQFMAEENLPSQAKELFHRYAAYTAPIMFAMGFEDAIPHASDVAQLTYLQAQKRGADEQQAMQAFLVGWLHDPKLPFAHSWSNLATHPVIATSIATKAFEEPEIQEALQTFLQSKRTKPFAEGVAEALSINNDSKWVLDNVILHQAKFHPLSQPGLADSSAEKLPLAQEIKTILTDRFLSPSKAAVIPPIPPGVRNHINTIELFTDLRGIDYDKLPEESRHEIDAASLKQLLDGKAENEELWKKAQDALKGAPHAIINPKVKGGSLTSHHAEVIKAPLAALGLAIADPLLLSPHKVMAQPKGSTATDRLHSYLNSLADNIEYLPRDAQADGKKWQNLVYLSMLKTADELTGNQTLTNMELSPTNENLRSLLMKPDTWKGTDGNFADLKPAEDPKTFATLLNALKKSYEATVNNVLLKPTSRQEQTLLTHRRTSVCLTPSLSKSNPLRLNPQRTLSYV